MRASFQLSSNGYTFQTNGLGIIKISFKYLNQICLLSGHAIPNQNMIHFKFVICFFQVNFKNPVDSVLDLKGYINTGFIQNMLNVHTQLNLKKILTSLSHM